MNKVTTYLRKKYEAEGRDAARETLRVIRTKDGHLTANLDNGTYWRIYDSVKNSYSLDKVESPEQFYITAKAFGRFAYDLNDFDASQLVEVIPQFHDTRNRYRQLEEAIREDRVGRVKEVQEEIAFICISSISLIGSLIAYLVYAKFLGLLIYSVLLFILYICVVNNVHKRNKVIKKLN